jgi:hypothetical protein
MKSQLLLSLFLFASLSGIAQKEVPTQTSICFIENKGQIRDKNGKQRTDIDLELKGGEVNVFIGEGKLHYQFARKLEEEKVLDTDNGIKLATYRMDVTLVGANEQSIATTEEPLSYYERYYRSGLGIEGVVAHSYNKVLYKDVYPGIDWVLYVKDNQLEYEFIVHEGADAKQIKIKYSGATSLNINKDGSLIATTPMGSITEAAPYCYTVKSKVAASYRLNNNELSFDIDHYRGKLVIDPSVVWGTFFYGNVTTQQLTDLECASPAEIYMCGFGADDGLGTTGAYQDTMLNGGGVFLVKFDSSGNRLWCTYYADSSSAAGLASDDAGNIYLYGITKSTDAIATPGCFQVQYNGGGYDCFLVKFTPSGARVWGTYYGGNSLEQVSSIHARGGYVYFTGTTSSATGIASGNGWQTAI